MRVLSGIQPTGRFHWGNYFGAIRQYIELQDRPENAFYFVANLHALTTVRDARQLWQNTLDAAIDLLALGLDPAAGHALRAVRRARGDPVVLAALKRRADGPLGALPRLQGEEGPRPQRRRRLVRLSGADGRRHPALRFGRGAGGRGPDAAHRGRPRPGGQLQPRVRPDLRHAQGQDPGQFGLRAGHRRPEDVQELRQHAGRAGGAQGAAEADHADRHRLAGHGGAQGAGGRPPLSALLRSLPARRSGRRWRPPIAAAVSATAR